MRLRHALAALALGSALPLSAASRVYVVDAAASSLRVRVGKTGVFSFAGHTHEVVAERLEGRIEADADDLPRSSVALGFEASGLKVLAGGEPAGDAPKVQDVMTGPKVLDAPRFPTISFRSRAVAGRRAADGAYELQVTGDLALHGVTRTMTIPVHVEVAGATLTATGRATVAQRAFGIEPVSAGGGTVKVKDEVGIDFRIVARPK